MPFIIRPPDPQELARQSREFFLAAVGRSESDVDSARARLEDSEAAYEALADPTWKDEQVLARAEENFDIAERAHKTNLLKLTWESDSQWKRKIKTNLKYTKALLAAVDWKHIFRARRT